MVILLWNNQNGLLWHVEREKEKTGYEARASLEGDVSELVKGEGSQANRSIERVFERVRRIDDKK